MSRYRRSQLAGATYFFTVALADRRSKLLVEHIDVLRQAYQKVQVQHPFVTVAICVLPDHLHAIWQMPADDGDFSLRWRLLKTYFSRIFLPVASRSESKAAKGEKGIWQRRYWEHQIRDDADLQNHVDYIHFNPVKHGLVQQAVLWPYSSFHRYVAKGLLHPEWGLAADLVGGFGERPMQRG